MFGTLQSSIQNGVPALTWLGPRSSGSGGFVGVGIGVEIGEGVAIGKGSEGDFGLSQLSSRATTPPESVDKASAHTFMLEGRKRETKPAIHPVHFKIDFHFFTLIFAIQNKEVR